MASNGQSDISVEFLKAHTIFAGIPDENLEKFRSYLDIQHFKKGDDILLEGARGDCLYLISAGNVEVLKKVLSKEEIGLERIAILGPGATFGEMEFVDNQPRSATVRALQDTTVLALSGTDIYKVTKADAHAQTFTLIIMNVAAELSRRLRTTDAYYAGSLFSIRKS